MKTFWISWTPRIFIVILGLCGFGVVFLNPLYAEELGYIPVPNSLVGYRTWPGVPPTIRLEVNPKSLIRIRSGSGVTLNIQAPDAQGMKLSDNPNFTDAPWREIKTEQPWILQVKNNQTVYTVYAVFRYRHPENNQFLISPIVHDSLHITQPHKKITRTASGYFDWHDLTLNIEAISSGTDSTSFIDLQKSAEEKSRQTAYLVIQTIPILTDYSLGDFLTLNRWMLPELRESVYNLKLEKAYYPTPQSIFLEESYSLLGNTPKSPPGQNQNQLQVYQRIIQDLYKAPPLLPNSPYITQALPALIIDIRKMNWIPTLLAEVVDDRGKVILSPADLSPDDPFENYPYLRYVRELENTGDWEIPESTLIIKALDVNLRNGQIIILEEYGKRIRSSEQQIQNLTKGNFYLITD